MAEVYCYELAPLRARQEKLNFSEGQDSLLRQMVADGLHLAIAAIVLGVNEVTVRRRAKKLGLKLRPI